MSVLVLYIVDKDGNKFSFDVIPYAGAHQRAFM